MTYRAIKWLFKVSNFILCLLFSNKVFLIWVNVGSPSHTDSLEAGECPTLFLSFLCLTMKDPKKMLLSSRVYLYLSVLLFSTHRLAALL